MILKETAMSFTAIRQRASDERYRRYAEAKSRIPRNLPPKEYEAAVKRLIKRYHI